MCYFSGARASWPFDARVLRISQHDAESTMLAKSALFTSPNFRIFGEPIERQG